MKTLQYTLVLALSVACRKGHCQRDSASGYSYFTGGRILVVPSSHQDIAWMNTIAKCIEYRDLHVITPALQRLKESSVFRFSMEDALSLYEYLDRHPDRLAEIAGYTRQGRLEWGATYNQPYEGLYDGEALIREAYYGKRKLEKLIPGGKFVCAWSEDVPGRSLQTPQIFAKAGIKFLQFSRFQPGLYKWYSPDGSFIACWTPGQYDDFGNPVAGAPTEAARTQAYIARLVQFNDYYRQRSLPPDFIYIDSRDFARPLDYDNYFAEWNARVGRKESDLPSIGYATGTEALEAAVSGKGKVDSIMGERPDVWVYIHGPTHEKAVKAGRNAARWLAAAEKFSTVDAVLDGSFAGYPQQQFDSAWQQAIYPDHGWGGVHGDQTDREFAASYAHAAATADSILRVKLRSIAGRIIHKTAGIPIVVFNPLSWTRTDPVRFTLNTEGIYTEQFQLVDSAGNTVDHQLTASPSGGADSYLTFQFIAAGVPSIGYKTYYLLPGKSGEAKALQNNVTGDIIDGAYYKVKLARGGIRSIYDKDEQVELLNPGKFLGGELFSMQSVGNDAGEFTDIQQPDMVGFEKMSQYAPEWTLLENGPVRTVMETSHLWSNCTVRERLIVYTTLKRIDLEADILGFNGERSREFRMAIPLNMTNGKVSYEVPMGIVKVGESELPVAAGFSKPEQVYSTPCREIHPREVQDWFGAADNRMSVTVSSDVAVFDWVDPTPQPAPYPILQPLLLATRKSCNWSSTAPWYLQRGDHHFTFSLFSHGGARKNGWKEGKQGDEPMIVVVGTGEEKAEAAGRGTAAEKKATPSLPEQFSFAGVDKDNMVISTIKKCEDDDAVILRCYELQGEGSEVKLRWFGPVRLLAKTSIIEEDPQRLPVGGEAPKAGATADGPKVWVGKYAIETYKLYK